MTYSPEQIRLIESLKGNGVTWKVIGDALGKKGPAVKAFWRRHRSIQGLPPKPVIDKSITAGRVGAKIKKAFRDKGYRSVSDITAQVKAEMNSLQIDRLQLFEETGVKETQITEETPSICQKCGASTRIRSGKLK